MSMTTWTSRLNTIASQAITVLALMAIGNAISGLMYNVAPAGSITDFQAQPIMTNKQRSLEKMGLTFDLEADFSSCSNWNTKQLFLWVVVEYQAPGFPLHTVTVWDRIITRPFENGNIISIDNAAAEYPVVDWQSRLSSQRSINVTAMVEVMPLVGVIRRYRLESLTVTLPPLPQTSGGN
jgi:signal peptidase complex subunit 3